MSWASLGMAFMGQARRQSPQPLQARLTRRLSRLQRETRLSSAPSGHRLRHQKRGCQSSRASIPKKISEIRAGIMRRAGCCPLNASVASEVETRWKITSGSSSPSSLSESRLPKATAASTT